MQFTLNKHSALFVLRQLRAKSAHARCEMPRTNILAPNPAPRKHWSKSCFTLNEQATGLCFGDAPYFIAVDRGSARTSSKDVKATVYASGLPEGSFVRVGAGIAMSSPELLFAELAQSMHAVEHLMLGHELCGTFSRDAQNPYNGPVLYNVEPVTSVEKIRSFLERAKSIRGIDAARASLARLNDNAWSPTESLAAAFMRLPVEHLGYDLGSLVLNPRVDLASPLPGAKAKRFPDIVIEGTPVGVNYDGLVHLDLDSIAKAALEVGMHPESTQPEIALNRAIRDVREKAADDIRRNRELSASGLSIFPILKEDLYEPGGLDQVVAELVKSIEKHTKRNMDLQKTILQTEALSHARHQMILSLLPRNHANDQQIYHRVKDLYVYGVDPGVSECWIEL